MSAPEQFYRIAKLPPYVFAVINELKAKARAAGQDVVDFGMGNPDGATPDVIVEKLVEAARQQKNHRYSMSRGIPQLRVEIVKRYQRNYGVELDPDKEAIVTIGAKDAIAHLLFAIIAPGDAVVSPNPAYPIHQYGVIMAEGEAIMLPMPDAATFLQGLEDLYKNGPKKPKVVLISFPHNPTTTCVDLPFMKEIVALARANGSWVVHDFAYADLGFDGYKPPSILEVPGAKDICVELSRIKSYLDYGTFQPIQIASIIALRECEEEPAKICAMYQERRDVLVDGLNAAGWPVERPRGSMFLWAKIPERFAHMTSLQFAQELMEKALVAVSPGIGFGPMGEGHVRFAFIENPHRTRQAVRAIKQFLRE